MKHRCRKRASWTGHTQRKLGNKFLGVLGLHIPKIERDMIASTQAIAVPMVSMDQGLFVDTYSLKILYGLRIRGW